MFGMTRIPTTTAAPQQVIGWNAMQQSGDAPLSLLLDEARQTNSLLKGILAILTNGPDWQQRATKSFDPEIFERVACLERQIADLRP